MRRVALLYSALLATFTFVFVKKAAGEGLILSLGHFEANILVCENDGSQAKRVRFETEHRWYFLYVLKGSAVLG